MVWFCVLPPNNQSRIRIDGVNVDHLQSMTTLEGPISWITSGKLDAVLDIKFPRDPHSDLPLNVILGEIADAISAAAAASSSSSSSVAERIPGQRELAKPPLTAPPSHDSSSPSPSSSSSKGDNDYEYDYHVNANEEGEVEVEGVGGTEDQSSRVVIDIDLRFRDLKAAVPIFTKELSYVNMALIRPIVYFMK